MSHLIPALQDCPLTGRPLRLVGPRLGSEPLQAGKPFVIRAALNAAAKWQAAVVICSASPLSPAVGNLVHLTPVFPRRCSSWNLAFWSPGRCLNQAWPVVRKGPMPDNKRLCWDFITILGDESSVFWGVAKLSHTCHHGRKQLGVKE